MGLRVNTNIASLAAQRVVRNRSLEQEKSYQRLATGRRIVNAGDDAAGLSISENLRAQIRSMHQAERNANDGISFVQVAEGGLNEIANMLVRLRELSIQAASDTVGDRERGFIQTEVESIVGEIDRIANVTSFNGTNLLNGESDKGDLDIQVGIRNKEPDRVNLSIDENDVTTSALGIDGIEASSIGSARDSLDSIDNAIDRVSGSRARLGAAQNKLRSRVNNLSINRQNLEAARSRVIDTDIADESAKLVTHNILKSTGISVLAQANVAPMKALELI